MTIKYMDKKLTPKQWAVEMLYSDLDNITDYYYERYSHEWHAMTQQEQKEISHAIDVFHNRIIKMLLKSRSKK